MELLGVVDVAGLGVAAFIMPLSAVDVVGVLLLSVFKVKTF